MPQGEGGGGHYASSGAYGGNFGPAGNVSNAEPGGLGYGPLSPGGFDSDNFPASQGGTGVSSHQEGGINYSGTVAPTPAQLLDIERRKKQAAALAASKRTINGVPVSSATGPGGMFPDTSTPWYGGWNTGPIGNTGQSGPYGDNFGPSYHISPVGSINQQGPYGNGQQSGLGNVGQGGNVGTGGDVGAGGDIGSMRMMAAPAGDMATTGMSMARPGMAPGPGMRPGMTPHGPGGMMGQQQHPQMAQMQQRFGGLNPQMQQHLFRLMQQFRGGQRPGMGQGQMGQQGDNRMRLLQYLQQQGHNVGNGTNHGPGGGGMPGGPGVAGGGDWNRPMPQGGQGGGGMLPPGPGQQSPADNPNGWGFGGNAMGMRGILPQLQQRFG